MIRRRLYTRAILISFFFGFLLLSGWPVLQSVSSAPVVSGRDIVILDESDNPSWKDLWDKAREYVRQKKYSLAAAAYAELIQAKPNIDEAKWEYCKVLVELKDWLTASDLLQGLLETENDRKEYLQLAATVALNNHEYKRAVDYFGRVYAADTGGPQATEALKGLIAGLQGLDRKNMAFPLMEQLYLRTPRDTRLLQDLARTAQELGELKKAREYYLALVDHANTDDRVLLQASLVFDEPGTEDKALAIWQKYLEKQPAYLPFHKKISDYYMKIGKPQAALPHILFMIDNGVEDDTLLLVAGKIFLDDEGRPDKALHYFEEYAAKHPEDISILVDIKRIQKVLANDFLSIVENDRAWILWRDLVQVTPNRLAIYNEMADQLEKKKKFKELLNVLLIINHFHPEDEANSFRIAALNYKLGKYADSLVFLKKIESNATGDHAYLRLRASVEDKLGLDLNALQHYEVLLNVKPDNLSIRFRCLELASRIGLVERMRKLYDDAPVNLDEEDTFNLKLRYAQGLRRNGMWHEVEDIYSELLAGTQNNPVKEAEVFFHKADSLREIGSYYQAEQILRELLARNLAVEKTLLRLAQLSLDNNDLDRAKDWFAILLKKNEELDWRTGKDSVSQDMLKLHIAILIASDSFDAAIKEIEAAQQKILQQKSQEKVQGLLLALRISLCRIYLQQEEYEKCLRLLTQLREERPKNLALSLLWYQLAKKKGKAANAYNEIDEAIEIAGNKSLVRTYDSAALALQHREYSVGLHHLEYMMQKVPESISARILKARLLTSQGDLANALQIYLDLSKALGEQDYFKQQILEIEYKLGNYRQIVKNSVTLPAEQPRSADEAQQPPPAATKDYWSKLMLARSLWLDKQWDASLKVYELLLAEPIQQEFEKAVSQQRVEIFVPPLKKSIWNMLSFTSSDVADPLAYYMEPEFVGRHIGQPIDKITANLYEKYRWQKLIRNEYLAKKAITQKDIKTAEIQYKKLIEEDSDIEGLHDLAKIYGRLGDYGKEAELYQTMKKYGSVYPGLDNSIAQNEIRRKPRLSGDLDIAEKKGREGNIDITRSNQGASLWFMPNLDKETAFSYKRNAYSSSSDEQTIRGNSFVGSYSHSLNKDTDLFFRLGGENFDQYDTTLLAGFEASRRLDEFLKGYVAFYQDRVYDTLAAIEAGIYAQDYKAGLVVDPQGGLVFGGDYQRRLYSDDNAQNQFYLWSGYNIYNELNTYSFQYSYTLIQNNDENQIATEHQILSDSAENMPYWSPGTYWEHLATLSFQHLLKSFSLLKETPSYYTLDYSIGFESGENLVNIVGFEIFLEMSPHFLLKGDITYSTSEDYEQKAALISLIYRW